MKHIAIALCFLTLSAGAFARGGERGRLREELGLNDEQVAKMKELREKKREQHKASREKVKVAREEFQAALRDPKASREQITAKFEALQKLQSERKRAQLDTMLEMRSLMNEEQIAKFQEKRKHWKKKKRGAED